MVDTNCIIEDTELAVSGARKEARRDVRAERAPGALALARSSLVGFVSLRLSNPTLVPGERRRSPARAPTAAHSLPSMMQFEPTTAQRGQPAPPPIHWRP
jgi:hypothetical protein